MWTPTASASLNGPLPMGCAATCRVTINVQEMAVEAALTGNRELVKLAVLHDHLPARYAARKYGRCATRCLTLRPDAAVQRRRTHLAICPNRNGGVLRAKSNAGEYRPPSLA